MLSERLNAQNLLLDFGRRIGFRLDRFLGHCDPVKENSLRLFPNSHLKAQPTGTLWLMTLYRSLVWPFTFPKGFRLLTRGI